MLYYMDSRSHLFTLIGKIEKMTESTISTPVKRGPGRPSKAELELRRLAELETNETDSERVARISARFDAMFQLAKGSLSGAIRSLIVSGAPGTGKSSTIEGLLSSAILHDPNMKYEVVRGTLTPINLFKLLYRNRNPNNIILLDDADGVFDDEDSLQLMKVALDTTSVRQPSWLSETSVLKNEDIPNTFEYNGVMIFITNKDFQYIVDHGKGKYVPHFAALMSRSIYLDLKLHTNKDLMAWVNHMILSYHILVQRGCTHTQEKMVMAWVRKHQSSVRELSIRTAIKAGDFVLSDASSWETIAELTLLR